MPIYVGANGMIFRATVRYRNGDPVNLGDAVELYFALRKPKQKGRLKCMATAEGDGSAGVMLYTSTASDVDQPGNYSVQGYVRMNDGRRFPTSIHSFPVAQG